MSKSDNFNANSGQLTKAYIRRLSNPTSEDQIERDFSQVKALPPQEKKVVLDGLVDEFMESLAKARKQMTREELNMVVRALKERPDDVLLQGIPAGTVRESQLSAHVVAHLMAEKGDAVPPEMKLYAEKLQAMSEEDFSSPRAHVEILFSLLAMPEKPIKKPVWGNPKTNGGI